MAVNGAKFHENKERFEDVDMFILMNMEPQVII